MYDKRIKEEFWTTLGRYLSLTPSASGEKISWLNYKTGIRNVQFKLEADDKHASVIIGLNLPDQTARERLFLQLKADADLLYQLTGDDWLWENNPQDSPGDSCNLIRRIDDVNIFRKEDWPQMISFFKTTITGLDQFWTEQKDFYEMIAG